MQERPETSEMALRKEDLEKKKVAQVRRQDVSRKCHEQKNVFALSLLQAPPVICLQ